VKQSHVSQPCITVTRSCSRLRWGVRIQIHHEPDCRCGTQCLFCTVITTHCLISTCTHWHSGRLVVYTCFITRLSLLQPNPFCLYAVQPNSICQATGTSQHPSCHLPPRHQTSLDSTPNIHPYNPPQNSGLASSCSSHRSGQPQISRTGNHCSHNSSTEPCLLPQHRPHNMSNMFGTGCALSPP
jgi:hypothetical protein